MKTGGSTHPGTVLYLGAGLCSDLHRYLAQAPERIYLVEPNPALAPDLAQICQAHPEVVHLPQAVTPEGGIQDFDIYNLFDISSFASPGPKLHAIYPGARVENTLRLDTLTPDALLATLSLPEGAPHTLVIDTPGQERALIEAFSASGQIDLFRRLVVNMPAQPLFAQSCKPAVIEKLLMKIGYVPQLQETKAAHPDWHTSAYVLGHQAKDLRLALAEVDDLRDRLTQAEEMIEELNAQAAALPSQPSSAAGANAAKIEEQLTAKLTTALRVQTHLQDSLKDLQARHTELQMAKDAQDMLLGSLSRALQSALTAPADETEAAFPPAPERAQETPE